MVMDFNEAVATLQKGSAVRRASWDAGAFLYFVPANTTSATGAEVNAGIESGSRFGGRIALMDGEDSQEMWKITAEDQAATDWEPVPG